MSAPKKQNADTHTQRHGSRGHFPGTFLSNKKALSSSQFFSIRRAEEGCANTARLRPSPKAMLAKASAIWSRSHQAVNWYSQKLIQHVNEIKRQRGTGMLTMPLIPASVRSSHTANNKGQKQPGVNKIKKNALAFLKGTADVLYILITLLQAWQENSGYVFKGIKERISSLNHDRVPDRFVFIWSSAKGSCLRTHWGRSGLSDIHTASEPGSRLSCHDERHLRPDRGKVKVSDTVSQRQRETDAWRCIWNCCAAKPRDPPDACERLPVLPTEQMMLITHMFYSNTNPSRCFGVRRAIRTALAGVREKWQNSLMKQISQRWYHPPPSSQQHFIGRAEMDGPYFCVGLRWGPDRAGFNSTCADDEVRVELAWPTSSKRFRFWQI